MFVLLDTVVTKKSIMETSSSSVLFVKCVLYPFLPHVW